METEPIEFSEFLVRVPKKVEQELRAIAAREKRSRNAQIAYILESWLRWNQTTEATP